MPNIKAITGWTVSIKPNHRSVKLQKNLQRTGLVLALNNYWGL